MKIETYETAVFSETPESAVIEGEMLNLIEELGLEGQKEFTKAQEGGEATTICPYRKMTKREMKVFELCFPNKTDLKSYKECLIPLRILQVAGHAKQFFPVIKVWYPEPGKPDPVLVGYESDSWSAQPHLLARWGEALDTFEELCIKAKKAALSKLAKSLLTCEAELDGAKKLLNNNANVDILDLPTNGNFYLNGV